jgi:hypothetical protein
VFLNGFLNSGGTFASESGKINTAEGGSTQRKPGNCCLSLRPSDLSRLKFLTGRERLRKFNKPVVGIGVGTSAGVNRLECLDHALSPAL